MPEKKLPRESYKKYLPRLRESYKKYWPYLRKVAKRLVIEGLKLSEKQIANITVSSTYTCGGHETIGVTYSSVTVSYSNCGKLVLRGVTHTDTNTFRVLFTPWDKRIVDTTIEVVIPLTATKKAAIELIEDSILAARL